MAFRVIRPDELEWTTRDHGPDEAPRHVAGLSELAGFVHTRANVWRYEPGAKGRRHKHSLQEETFVVLAGTLSMYLGDTPERQDVPMGAHPRRAGHTAPDGEPRRRGSRPVCLRNPARARARRDPRLGAIGRHQGAPRLGRAQASRRPNGTSRRRRGREVPRPCLVEETAADTPAGAGPGQGAVFAHRRTRPGVDDAGDAKSGLPQHRAVLCRVEATGPRDVERDQQWHREDEPVRQRITGVDGQTHCAEVVQPAEVDRRTTGMRQPSTCPLTV